MPDADFRNLPAGPEQAEAERNRLRAALEGLFSAVNRFHQFRPDEPDENCYICPAMRRAEAALAALEVG